MLSIHIKKLGGKRVNYTQGKYKEEEIKMSGNQGGKKQNTVHQLN